MPHLKKLPSNLWSWRKQDKIVFIRDSYIDFRSADNPENWEGFGYDKSFLNEAGIILKNAYLWDHAIRPMYWDYPYGKHVIGGTPKGKGKFFELYERGIDPSQTQYQSLRFTSFDNPYLDRKALEEEMKDMPERVIQQEIYAQFLDDTGVVFRGVKDVMIAQPKKPEPEHMYVMGVDLAKVQDFTVITVYDRDNNSQVYQDRFKDLEWPFVKKKIQSVCRHYNNALTLIDSTGLGEPIFEDLVREGVPIEPYKFTNESKKQLIENLVVDIEQKRIQMLPIEDTLREFNNFTYDISSSGRIMYQAPVGFHDDIVMAHALAVWSLHPIIKEKEVKEPTPTQMALRQRLRRYEGDDTEQWNEWANE